MENLEMSPGGHSNLINFHRCEKHSGKVVTSSKILPGRAGYPAGQSEIRALSLIFTAVSSKWIEDSINHEMLRGTLGRHFRIQALARTFWKRDS